MALVQDDLSLIIPGQCQCYSRQLRRILRVCLGVLSPCFDGKATYLGLSRRGVYYNYFSRRPIRLVTSDKNASKGKESIGYMCVAVGICLGVPRHAL